MDTNWNKHNRKAFNDYSGGLVSMSIDGSTVGLALLAMIKMVLEHLRVYTNIISLGINESTTISISQNPTKDVLK